MTMIKCNRFYLLTVLLLLIFYVTVYAKRVGGCNKDSVEGSQCNQLNAEWQSDGVCIFKDQKPQCYVPDSRNFTFTLVASMKYGSNYSKVDRLWIRGSGPSLSWENPTLMKKSKQMKGLWTLDISYLYDSNSMLCVDESHCSINQKALELRVYRDKLGKDGMLGPNIVVHLPVSNSMMSEHNNTVPKVTIYPWFDGEHVELNTTEIMNPLTFHPLTKSLKVTILYPPSFNYNLYKRYPVVVLFGTTEGKRIRPLLRHMYVYENSIEEAFIINIHYKDVAPFCALNPFTAIGSSKVGSEKNVVWFCPDQLPIHENPNCAECQSCLNTDRLRKCDPAEFNRRAKSCLQPYTCSGKGGVVLDIIENSVLHEVQIMAQNRLKLNFPKERMSVIGFDGAGLLACFAALSRPMYYSNAACLSAPFHWPLRSLQEPESRKSQGIGDLLMEINERIILQPEQLLLYTQQKYYIDVGENDNFYLPIIDAHNYTEWLIEQLQDKLKIRDILYFPNVINAGNSYYHNVHGGLEVFNRVKTVLLFFLRAEGGPNSKYTRLPKFSENSYEMQKQEVFNDTVTSLSSFLKNMMGNSSEVKEINRCPTRAETLERYRRKSVSVSVYLLSTGLSILMAVLGTVVIMHLREANKKAADVADKEDAELMKDLEDMSNGSEDL